jgi:hypothetical protein
MIAPAALFTFQPNRPGDRRKFLYFLLVAVGDGERVFARCFGHLCLNDSEAQIADSGDFLVAFPQARQEQRVLQVSLRLKLSFGWPQN